MQSPPCRSTNRGDPLNTNYLDRPYKKFFPMTRPVLAGETISEPLHPTYKFLPWRLAGMEHKQCLCFQNQPGRSWDPILVGAQIGQPSLFACQRLHAFGNTISQPLGGSPRCRHC